MTEDEFHFRFALAQPADKRGGAVMVTLLLNEDGRVITTRVEPYHGADRHTAELAAFRAGLGALPEKQISDGR